MLVLKMTEDNGKQFAQDFNNEDGADYPIPADVEDLIGLELEELPIEDTTDTDKN